MSFETCDFGGTFGEFADGLHDVGGGWGREDLFFVEEIHERAFVFEAKDFLHEWAGDKGGGESHDDDGDHE